MKEMATLDCSQDESTEFLFDEDELREEHSTELSDLEKALEEHSTELSDLEKALKEAVRRDDRARLILLADREGDSAAPIDPGSAARLLQLACRLDSTECARALLDGEAGTVVRVNEMDEAGRTPLHTAAGAHSSKCVELLLSRNACTDLKSKDGKSLRALESALLSKRMQVEWSPNEPVEALVALLCEMDLSTVSLLAEGTKNVAEISYTYAIGGRAVALASLLLVAADKVVSPITLREERSWGVKRSISVYECVLDEALALGTMVKMAGSYRWLGRSRWDHYGLDSAEDCLERRELLLCEIEMLQLFGAVAVKEDKKVMPPLLRASQAGDEAIVKLLLKTDADVNDIGADGNSSLHWCLKSGVNAQEIRILWLLLKQGANASQRNKLGLTPFHVAAEKGNYQALEILLLHAPECIDIASETKETPLFFAVKNDFVDCVRLLLNYGAKSNVFNIRRQRPIDMAKSLDMRFVLSRTNKGFWSRARPIQETGHAYLSEEEDVYQEIFRHLDMDYEHSNTERSGTKSGTCRYYRSPTGSVRGPQCYYTHGEGKVGRATGSHEERRQQSLRFETRCPIQLKHNLHRKIFVGGLPPSVDSDCLADFFKTRFGPVEEAVVIGMQKEDQVHSRGFGFVTFEREESTVAAIKAHFVNILGKRVEIKTALPKSTLLTQGISTNLRDEPKVKPIAPGMEDSLSEHNPPLWLSKFKEWLPVFLKEETKWLAVGEWYPLSSLKSDFRATCGMELVHASLGFLKLGDFMRSLPGICRMRVVPVKGGSASHMVLLPALPGPHDEQLPEASTLSPQSQASTLSPQSQASTLSPQSQASTLSPQPDLPAEERNMPSKDDHSNATPAVSTMKPVEPSQSSPISELASDLSWILKSLFNEKDYFSSTGYGGTRSNPAGTDTLNPSFHNHASSSMTVFHEEYPVGWEVGVGGAGSWMQSPQEPYNCGGTNAHPFSLSERQWDHFLLKRGLCIVCKEREGLWVMIPCFHKICKWCKEIRPPCYCMICGAVVHGFRPSLQAGIESQSPSKFSLPG